MTQEKNWETSFIPLVTQSHKQQPIIMSCSTRSKYTQESKIPKLECMQPKSPSSPQHSKEEKQPTQQILEGCIVNHNTLFEPGEIRHEAETPVPRDWSHVQNLYQSKWGVFSHAQQNRTAEGVVSNTTSPENLCAVSMGDQTHCQAHQDYPADELKTIVHLLAEKVEKLGTAMEQSTSELNQLKYSSKDHICGITSLRINPL